MVTPNLRFRWQVKFFASLGLAKVERLRLQLDSAGGGSVAHECAAAIGGTLSTASSRRNEESDLPAPGAFVLLLVVYECLDQASQNFRRCLKHRFKLGFVNPLNVFPADDLSFAVNVASSFECGGGDRGCRHPSSWSPFA